MTSLLKEEKNVEPTLESIFVCSNDTEVVVAVEDQICQHCGKNMEKAGQMESVEPKNLDEPK